MDPSWVIALRSAAMVEKTAGPRAALQLYATVAGNTPDMLTKGHALLAACSCAVAADLRDRAAPIVAGWVQVSQGEWEAPLLKRAMQLRGRGWHAEALDLVRTEARLRPRARLVYLHGRLALEARDLGTARSAFEAAAQRADREGAKATAASARVRLALLTLHHGREEDAVAHAKAADATVLDGWLAMARARVMLLSNSRFVRAEALAALEHLTLGPQRLEAARLALSHADALGPGLTPVETERIVAVAKRALDERTFALVAQRLKGTSPVAATPAGAREIGAEERAAGRLAELCQACAQSIRSERGAEPRCAELAFACEGASYVPSAVWAVVLLLLERPEGWAKGACERLVSVIVQRPHGRPLRGYAAVCRALRLRGLAAVAESVLHVGAGRREPDAAAERAAHMVREAWALAHDDPARSPPRDARKARELLLAAKRLQRLS